MSPGDTCPECQQPAQGRWVALAVSIAAGDDDAGSETTARVRVCGGCGQKLLTHFVGLATNAQIARTQR